MKVLAIINFYILFVGIPAISIAQKFAADENGYVANHAFHKLIKQRGYQLVGSFDTVSRIL